LGTSPGLISNAKNRDKNVTSNTIKSKILKAAELIELIAVPVAINNLKDGYYRDLRSLLLLTNLPESKRRTKGSRERNAARNARRDRRDRPMTGRRRSLEARLQSYWSVGNGMREVVFQELRVKTGHEH